MSGTSSFMSNIKIQINATKAYSIYNVDRCNSRAPDLTMSCKKFTWMKISLDNSHINGLQHDMSYHLLITIWQI